MLSYEGIWSMLPDRGDDIRIGSYNVRCVKCADTEDAAGVTDKTMSVVSARGHKGLLYRLR